MLGCGKFLSVGGEFFVQQVVELLCACPSVVLYNMSVAGVRVVEFGTKRWLVVRLGHYYALRNVVIIHSQKNKINQKACRLSVSMVAYCITDC